MSETVAAAAKRSRLSFSLRALLVLTTVIAIGLAAVAWRLQAIRAQQRVLAELRSLAATLTFVHEINRTRPEMPGPKWLRQLLGDDFAVEVAQVQLQGEHVTDDTLAMIATLPRIDSLIVRSEAISDRGLASLARGPGFDALQIDSGSVTAAGFAKLIALPKLENLYIASTNVDDSWLPELVKLTKVEGLGVGTRRITDDGLKHLQQATHLRRLGLQGTDTSREAIDELQKALPDCRIYWP